MVKKSKNRVFEDNIRKILQNSGVSEITSYSFIGENLIGKLFMDLSNTVKIINPLGEEYSIMRKSLLPNLVDVIAKNLNYNNEDLLVYELGNTFYTNDNDEFLPKEEKKLSIGCYGKFDFYYLKNIVSNLFDKMNILSYEFVRNTSIKYLHSGISADILINGIFVGKIGQLSHKSAKNFSIKKSVYICELDIEKIYLYYNPITIYKPLVKYPSIKRDLAIVIDESIDCGQIENSIKEVNSLLLKNIELFDVYVGEQIANQKKSVAYKLTFQSDEKTLTDDEINTIIKKIVQILEQKYDAYLRS